MSLFAQFRIATQKEKSIAVARLVKASTGDLDFYLFALLGTAMACLGLVLDSPEIVIGSMLIAPILYPILSLALGAVLLDSMLVLRSLRTLVLSVGAAFTTAFAVAVLLHPPSLEFSSQIFARTELSFLYFIVACISGFAASYALVNANVNETLPGVAISVSLVPPLAVVGITAAALAWDLALVALSLFLVNVAGVIFASMVAFTLMDLHSVRRIADSAIGQEERRLEKVRATLESLERSRDTL